MQKGMHNMALQAAARRRALCGRRPSWTRMRSALAAARQPPLMQRRAPALRTSTSGASM